MKKIKDCNAYQIFEAEEQDLELLMKMRKRVLFEVFSLDGQEAGWQNILQNNEAFYKEQLKSRQHIALVAMKENVCIACGNVCFQQEMPSPDNPSGRCAYLMNIFTEKEFRNLQIATEIVTLLIDLARKHHCDKIYLETSKAGRRLYEKLGFVDYPDMMKLPVGAQNDS